MQPRTRVKLTTLDNREAILDGWAENLSVSARLKRVAKVVVWFWAIAAFTVLLPILHFILPPALLLCGACAGLAVWRQARIVRDARGPCPSCGEPLSFPLLVRRERMKDTCPSCRHSFRISFDQSANA